MLIIFVHMSETFWTSKSQSVLKVKDIENFVVWNMSYMMVKFRNSPHSSGKPHIQLQIGFYIEKTQSWVKKVEGWIWEELAEWKWIWSKSVIWNPQRTIKNTSKRVFNFFLGPISISICWYICENEEGSKDWRQQDLAGLKSHPSPPCPFSLSLSLWVSLDMTTLGTLLMSITERVIHILTQQLYSCLTVNGDEYLCPPTSVDKAVIKPK